MKMLNNRHFGRYNLKSKKIWIKQSSITQKSIIQFNLKLINKDIDY